MFNTKRKSDELDINVPVCIQYVSVCIILVSVSISDVLHIFHVCLYLKYCFAVSRSPGCFHNDVSAEPGSWIVIGTIPIFQVDCPREGRVWWPSTAEIGSTKLLYMPSPDTVVCNVPLSHR